MPFIVKVNIVLMVTGTMGLEPILPVTIGTVLNFDGEGYGYGIGTCKHTLTLQ